MTYLLKHKHLSAVVICDNIKHLSLLLVTLVQVAW